MCIRDRLQSVFPAVFLGKPDKTVDVLVYLPVLQPHHLNVGLHRRVQRDSGYILFIFDDLPEQKTSRHPVPDQLKLRIELLRRPHDTGCTAIFMETLQHLFPDVYKRQVQTPLFLPLQALSIL